MDDIRNMEGGIPGKKTPLSSEREDMLHLDGISEKLPATPSKSPPSYKTDGKEWGEEYMLTRTNSADWVPAGRLTVTSPVSAQVIQTVEASLGVEVPLNVSIQKESRHSQWSKNRALRDTEPDM